MFLKNNRVYLAQNNPNQLEANFIYIDLDPKTNLITTVYQDTINTSNTQNILWGVPTRVNYVGPGLDDNNLLILMTLTLPKGAKDIKNSMILGNATTYQVIISRVIGATLKPFTVQDYYYGKKQAGSTNYYDYQLYTISSQVDTNGVSALNQIMSNLICLEISWLLKSTRVWATCDRQDPDLDLHLQISQKRKQYLRT